MKNILITFCMVVLIYPSSQGQKNWKASDYKPVPYRKVMVLAKVLDTRAKKQLEDYTAKLLKDKGIVAIPAYANVMKTDGVSREAFLKIADSLQVDALLVYEVNGTQKHTEVTSTVSVGVGVGGYGGYAATSVPISANTRQVTAVKMSVYFYNRASVDEQWAKELSGSTADGTDKLAYTFAKATVKDMMNDGLFVTKK